MHRLLRSRYAVNQFPKKLLPRQCLSNGAGIVAATCLSTSSYRLYATEAHEPVDKSSTLGGNPDIQLDNLQNPTYHVKTPGSKKNRGGIRSRLRKWELENASINTVEFQFEPPPKGSIENGSMTGGGTMRIVSDPYQDGSSKIEDKQAPFFESGELVDLGDARPFLLKGDMVDLNISNSREPELAIFVRDLEGYSQYYTMTGRWVNSRSGGIIFTVPQFVAPEEVDCLIPYLPTTVGPASEEDRLQNFKTALPRAIGAPLVRKLLDFLQQTRDAYRSYADRLRYAHDILASDDVLRYCTVHQVAHRLLSESGLKLSNGQFHPHVLYAIHRTLLDEGSGFRPQKGAAHSYGSRYEISSKKEMSIVRRVTQWVRDYQEGQVLGRHEASPIAEFIPKAQQLIDMSRKHRDFTEAGTIGPIKRALSHDNSFSEYDDKQFSSSDIEIIRFLEYWVSLSSFDISSSRNGIGSQILRAINRYSDVDLDRKMGWTFLQEIGIFSPWESKAAFEARLPNTGFQLSSKEICLEQENSVEPLEDSMAALRKDWASMPVYCIDDPEAHEIDDGVSLERINDNHNEHWVHIHTADPASHIKPSSGIGKSAQQMVSSVYLPERMIPMIPRNITLNRFSLANGRPSLTFSARMNDAGDILETKITPGYVRNVKFVTPPIVEEIVSGRKPLEDTSKLYIVGQPSSSGLPGREMSSKDEFTSEDKENLQKLHFLGLMRQEKAIERGAMPALAAQCFNRLEASVSVQLNEERQQPLPSVYHYHSDPTIKFRTGVARDISHEKTTTNLMLLAGEISAMWCHERNIPVVYRVTPRKPGSKDLRSYIQEVLLPAIKKDGEPSPSQRAQFKQLLGVVRASTIPGPHLGLGVAKFSRCTSPLRRYLDLLLHWQVEAALLEEAKTGKSLVGSTREDYLPFSKKDVDDMVPVLEGKESMVRLCQRLSTKAWIMIFILRAWKFNESSIPFPQTFSCKVTTDWNPMTLDIEFLQVSANAEYPAWLKKGDVKVGDVFECEFEDVNVYMPRVKVKILRRV